jgi:hypothetical protein
MTEHIYKYKISKFEVKKNFNIKSIFISKNFKMDPTLLKIIISMATLLLAGGALSILYATGKIGDKNGYKTSTKTTLTSTIFS